MSGSNDGAGGQTQLGRLVRPFKVFAEHKLAGAILLMTATAAALVWANSPWAETYEHLLELDASVSIGGAHLEKTLHHWINDGLMAVFFFVVGLEIKREIIAGELSSARKAALPIVAAVGGMAVPAAVFLIVNAGTPTAHGWGVPTATDIAFALGALALLGDRVPVSLKVFLTALAIVDDILAVLIIALFYSEGISLVAVGVGFGFFALSVAFNRLGVKRPAAYLIVGVGMWLAFLQSGVHATLAAVLMALTIPARASLAPSQFVARVRDLLARIGAGGQTGTVEVLEHDQQHALEETGRLVDAAVPPLQRLEHGLMPVVTFLVMPVFALANAGVHVGGDFAQAATSPVAVGVVLGLFLGKQVGVTLFAWLAIRLGLAAMPTGIGWRQLHAVSVLAGIGFTMSLFVAGLAFSDPTHIEGAKIGVLAASVLSGVVGLALLRSASGSEQVPPTT